MDNAQKLGAAFRCGVAYARGRRLAQDASQWITVKPNGQEHKGRPVLIDSESGEILGGAGGKLNGQKVGDLKAKRTRAEERKRRREERRQKSGAAEPLDFSLPEKIDKSKILQNRERSNQGSIMQMQAISKNPDYSRLGVTHDFGSGAPVVAYGKVPKRQLGKIDTATMPDGTKYRVQYAVVDAGDVLTSNNMDGSSNKAYYSDDPSEMRAIAGNGRITALRQAYKQGTADTYFDEMSDDAGHGISADVIDEMESPILVRIMQPKDVTADIGDKSNTAGQLSMTATETANNDANRINFESLTFYDDGSPTVDSVKEFVAQMPASEQGGLIDIDGTPTRSARDRLNAAIFAKAYQNDGLTRLMTQALDPESQTIISGLMKAAPKMQRLAGLADGFDVRDLVSRAAERAVISRRAGRKLQDEASQTTLLASRDDDDATSAIVKVFADNPRSPKAIAEKLGKMADFLYNEATKEGFDLFGEVQKLGRNEALKRGLAQDKAAGKMSPAAAAYWAQKGREFFEDVFSGRLAQDEFFAGLKKKARG